MIVFKSERLGAHTHVKVFVGKDKNHLALAGNLVMRPEEFAELENTRGVLKRTVALLKKFKDDVRDKGDEIREEIDEVWREDGGPEALAEAAPYVSDGD